MKYLNVSFPVAIPDSLRLQGMDVLLKDVNTSEHIEVYVGAADIKITPGSSEDHHE